MPCPSFLPPVTFPVGQLPIRSAAADFNGDGLIDLAVVNSLSGNVTILINNNSGSFTTAGTIPVGGRPSAITAADFNEDGRPDLAVANQDDTISILFGNGDGTFASGTPIALPPFSNPTGITSADYDGNLSPDLAVANNGIQPGTGSVSVFLNDGFGNFLPAPGSPFLTGTGANPYALVSVDVDGNAIPDLAVTDWASNSVAVLINDGSAMFTLSSQGFIPVGSLPVAIVAADMTGEGFADLAVANLGSSDVFVLLNDGTGTFTPTPDSPIALTDASAPFDLAAADFNCDGLIDLATANIGINSVTVLLNGGVAGFSQTRFAVGNLPLGVTAADLNNDGRNDLAVALGGSNAVAILINDSTPMPVCPLPITMANDPGKCGATVTFTAIESCASFPVACIPASGSFFPIGTTTVTCTATDHCGNTASCSFPVTVVDKEPPVIACPMNIQVPNDKGQPGAVVAFPAPSVQDNCPGAVATCSPASGSFFPIGTTIVTCSAVDASGNTASCSFEVTVLNTENPIIIQPENIIVHIPPESIGTKVSFPQPTVIGFSPVNIVFAPPSGSFFRVGETKVTVTATDKFGHTAQSMFFVIVIAEGEE